MVVNHIKPQAPPKTLRDRLRAAASRTSDLLVRDWLHKLTAGDKAVRAKAARGEAP